VSVHDQVIEALDALGVDYERVPIDPDYAATADFCARYGYEPAQSGNCIVVVSKRGERRHAACVVPATRRLDVNGTVRRLLGVSKASFAPAEETVALTGMQPDGVTPFGLPPGVPVYVDAALMACDRIVVGGGDRASKVVVTPAAFDRLPGATVVEGLSKSAPNPS
jgi:prolyl-tRNA editing enzyme YbaK/EbsC (Cys-tRNA(Pro) deacylase)